MGTSVVVVFHLKPFCSTNNFQKVYFLYRNVLFLRLKNLRGRKTNRNSRIYCKDVHFCVADQEELTTAHQAAYERLHGVLPLREEEGARHTQQRSPLQGARQVTNYTLSSLDKQHT